jgi:hypothetical protein
MQIQRIASSVVGFLFASSGALCAQAQVYVWSGVAPTDEFGWSVASVGDLNGDGVREQVVGSYKDDQHAFDAGMARVFSGKTGSILYEWLGDASGDWFGHSVASAGDFNHDGVEDVVVGSRAGSLGLVPVTGTARVFSGATGVILVTRGGDASLDAFGYSVAGVGDVNHDLYDDVIVGAPFNDFAASNAGRIKIITSSPFSIVTTIYTIDGTQADEFFGFSVDGAGDVNGDGWKDFIVGAPDADAPIVVGGPDRGMARVYSGRTGAPIWTWYGDVDGDELGFSVSGAGDVDHDGFADCVVGARYAGTSSSGMVRVYSGRTGLALWTAYADPGWAYFGAAVNDAGDFDGDGFADVIASTDFGGTFSYGVARVFSGATGAVLHTFDGYEVNSHEFGESCASAGDLNGDGKGDLIIGARGGVAGALQGSAHVFLSGYALASSYCTAKTNSLGCVPAISSTGAASLSIGDNFVISVSNVLNHKSGLIFWGTSTASAPFGGGTMCIGLPRIRTPVQDSGGTALPASDCTGVYSFHFSQAYMASQSLTAGTTVYTQSWSRDPGFTPPNNINLSDGLSFPVCP